MACRRVIGCKWALSSVCLNVWYSVLTLSGMPHILYTMTTHRIIPIAWGNTRLHVTQLICFLYGGCMRKERTNKYTIYTIIWSNIRRHQYLFGMTDEQLGELLGISTRTLYAYDKNPAVLTLEKIEQFLNGTGIEMQSLITV